MAIERRSFFWSIIAAIAALRRSARGQASLSPENSAALREVARVVLPASLGETRTDQIAAQFAQWVRDYRAGADAGYGYGFPRLQVTPANPSSRYADQLRQLEEAAARKGAPFAKLDIAAKRALVASALEEANVERLPQRPNAQHVATDLMAYFFNSSAGEDFLYRAAIRRDECRGLASSGERPAALG